MNNNPNNKNTENSLGVDKIVFWFSLAVAVAFILWGIFANESLGKVAGNMLGFLTSKFGWLYILSSTGLVFLAIYLGFSKYGKIKLGQPNEEPEFSFTTWIAMLFSAGVAIGLVFWGVAQPIMHYAYPPVGEGKTAESALVAIRYVFFLWGAHPWAIYSVFGLAIAYFGYRRGLRQLPSSTIYPLVGKKGIEGWAGKTIDIFCVLATLLGVCTSLGFGAIQVNSGLSFLFGIPNNTIMAVIIIAVITVAFIISAITGLEKGIKYLSNINMTLATVILIFMIIVGPTIFIIELFTQGIGGYIQHFFEMAFFISPVKQNPWAENWTVFFLAWWMAWTPCVGAFISRISRGRTIKEFVLGTIFVPSVVSFIWMTVMGGSAIWVEHFGAGGIVEAVNKDVASAFFVALSHFPLSSLMSIIVTCLICTFFITSADSATFVMGMMSSKGSLNPKASVKVVWGIVTAGFAIIMMLAKGLEGLESAVISGAFPFIFLYIIIIVALMKALKKDYDFIKQDKFIGTIDINQGSQRIES